MIRTCVRTMMVTAAVTLSLSIVGLASHRNPKAEPAYYVSVAGDDIFRRPDCPLVSHLTTQSLWFYKTKDDALAADLKPCPYCFSEKSKRWRPPGL